MVTIKEIRRVALILFLGSIGAPIIYIITGVVHPCGFHFFIKNNLVDILIPFMVVWAASFVYTAIIGGIVWMPLHKYKIDSALIYIIVAIVSSSLLSLSTSHEISLLGIGMSSTNAIIIRWLEISVLKLHTNVT